MIEDEFIAELWTLRLNPSDLYNIERPLGVGPVGGGGHTYIQVPAGQKQNLLRFLNAPEPSNGHPIVIEVFDRADTTPHPQRLEFHSKSADRMRIARQNRFREGQDRLRAWSPESGFPALEGTVSTPAADQLLRKLGGVHIFLARTIKGRIWAGFTAGEANATQLRLPFSSIAWGDSPGGYWEYKGGS